MTFVHDMQRILKQYRIMLTSLRTPKLRKRFTQLLAEQDDNSSANPVTESGIDKPFKNIDWLNTAYDDGAQEALSQQIDALNQLLGPYSLLYTDFIDDLPLNWEERKQMIRRICERVFSVPVANRKWLTEAEYNARLSMVVADVVTIRRYSIDMRIVERDDRGERYWLA